MENSILEPVDDATVRHHVAQRLTHHIVTGSFAPGQRLTEQELARSLRVSRGPLREAIRELAEAGLLVTRPYKGLFVRSVSRKDIEELYSLRTVLEGFAFQLAWDKRTKESVDDLHERNAALKRTVETGTDGPRAIEQELHLHSWCYELSGHALLRRSWENMRPHISFYFSLHQKAHNRKGPLRESHDTYVELACGTELSAMLDHLKDHMRQGLAKTVDELADDLPE